MCSNVTIGIMVLAVFSYLPVTNGIDDCRSIEATLWVQANCKEENDNLLAAESNKDKVEICRTMAAMLVCTVSTLPHCYDHFEATFNTYFHSPYHCDLSAEQVMELQAIHNKGTEQDVTLETTSVEPLTVQTKIEVYIKGDIEANVKKNKEANSSSDSSVDDATSENDSTSDLSSSATPTSPSVLNTTSHAQDVREIRDSQPSAEDLLPEEHIGTHSHNAAARFMGLWVMTSHIAFFWVLMMLNL